MAFDGQQTRRARVAVAVAALAIAAAVGVAAVSGVFSGSGAPSDGDAGSAKAASSGGADAAQGATSDEHDMSHVDLTYRTTLDQLEGQYEADPSNPSALLNLANGYFDWGVAAMGVAADDEDAGHVADLFNHAIERYDEYLEANPGSKSVEVDRAISIFYAGDADRAIATLEEFTAADDSFGPAWANLGMFYESAGRAQDARAAYERAVACDPDDAYGVRTYAQQRLDALQGTDS